jgi:hypothetical protein
MANAIEAAYSFLMPTVPSTIVLATTAMLVFWRRWRFESNDSFIQIVRDSGGEGLSKEQLAIVFEMSVAESLAQAEEWQQEAEQARAAAHLFEGLPKCITLAWTHDL